MLPPCAGAPARNRGGRQPVIRLFRYIKPYAIPIAAVIVLVFTQSLADLYMPTLMSDIVDTGIVNGDTPYILRIGGSCSSWPPAGSPAR